MDKTKNVFISHHSKDEEHIGKLKDLLTRQGYQIKNSSIDSTKPNQANNEEYIKRLLRLRIQWAGTFICLVGSETHNRDWVNWEIEQAHKKDKRIVGVYIRGAKGTDVPENLNKYGHSLVTWQSDKIADAIEGGLEGKDNWCDPEGNPRESVYEIIRTTC
ncbi:MAG: TIR domain-containing protein [Balneolaceae bacterium]